MQPDDYGIFPTVGELVIHTNTEIAVKRSDERLGTLCVHFPRTGFEVLPVSAL